MAIDIGLSMQAIIIILLSLYNTSAFVPYTNKSRLTTSYTRHTTIIKIDTSEDNASSSDIDATTNDSNQRRNTVARAGGRRPKVTKPTPEIDDTKKESSSFLRQWTLPIILLVILRLLSSVLFGGSTPNVVYYSSSYYSSTTYNKDGNIETTRKSEFKSNIPNLVEKSKEYSQSQLEERNYRDDSITIDIRDDELEDEIDSFLYQK